MSALCLSPRDFHLGERGFDHSVRRNTLYLSFRAEYQPVPEHRRRKPLYVVRNHEVAAIERRPPNIDAWHTDVTMDLEPPMGSILRAVDVPPVGGDTLWASMYAAYESLPRPVQAITMASVVVPVAMPPSGSCAAKRPARRPEKPICRPNQPTQSCIALRR